MSSEPGSTSHNHQIWVAVIGMIGAVAVAVIANWRSIFPPPIPSESTQIVTPTAASTTPTPEPDATSIALKPDVPTVAKLTVLPDPMNAIVQVDGAHYSGPVEFPIGVNVEITVQAAGYKLFRASRTLQNASELVRAKLIRCPSEPVYEDVEVVSTCITKTTSESSTIVTATEVANSFVAACLYAHIAYVEKCAASGGVAFALPLDNITARRYRDCQGVEPSCSALCRATYSLPCTIPAGVETTARCVKKERKQVGTRPVCS